MNVAYHPGTSVRCPLCSQQFAVVGSSAMDVRGPMPGEPTTPEVVPAGFEHLHDQNAAELVAHLQSHSVEQWLIKVNQLQRDNVALREQRAHLADTVGRES